ncbi:MAG: hypothetical protein NTW20_02695 [Rhodobacterales bacterium]|nr:hypothetical protein [Rhodobacterales bacterium]
MIRQTEQPYLAPETGRFDTASGQLDHVVAALCAATDRERERSGDAGSVRTLAERSRVIAETMEDGS